MATPASQLSHYPRAIRLGAGARAFDLMERGAAIAGLVCSSPVLILAGLAVRALSGQSPLVAHRRVGLGGTPFWLLKVRTMWGSEAIQSPARWIEYLPDTYVPLEKNAVDPRVTSRLAKILRRYSIDELPQLFHVAAGLMRMIGPRPLTGRELATYYGPSATAEIVSVPPGLTGLWQVMGRNRLTYSQRKRLDLFLVRHRGFGLSLKILLLTPARVLLGRDAW